MTTIASISLNDGKQIPQLGLGTSPMDDTEVETAVTAALDVGYRHIDTAAMYNNEVGVGKAIAGSGIARDEVFITTKLSNKFHRESHFRQALEQSLERLAMDHVDLYLIHWPLPERQLFTAAWETLIDLRAEGLATSIGVSNFLPEHLDLIQDETGITPAVNQFELHPTFQPEELINYCTGAQIAVEAYAPLGNASDLGDETITEIAQRNGISPAQVILAWHIARGFIAIPKSRTPERIKANYEAASLKLSPGDLERIDQMNRDNKVWAQPLEVN